MRDNRDSLDDIMERILLTEEFVQPGRDTFFSSRMAQEAVIRNLEIIGEASRNLTDDLKDKHPEVPWKRIGAFRNFVAHAYWTIKLDHVWAIVENDLPVLKPQIEAIIAEINKQEGPDG